MNKLLKKHGFSNDGSIGKNAEEWSHPVYGTVKTYGSEWHHETYSGKGGKHGPGEYSLKNHLEGLKEEENMPIIKEARLYPYSGKTPAHAEIHDTLTNHGFNAKSHDPDEDFGILSRYQHPKSKQFAMVTKDGSWNVGKIGKDKQRGNGKESLEKHLGTLKEENMTTKNLKLVLENVISDTPASARDTLFSEISGRMVLALEEKKADLAKGLFAESVNNKKKD